MSLVGDGGQDFPRVGMLRLFADHFDDLATLEAQIHQLFGEGHLFLSCVLDLFLKAFASLQELFPYPKKRTALTLDVFACNARTDRHLPDLRDQLKHIPIEGRKVWLVNVLGVMQHGKCLELFIFQGAVLLQPQEKYIGEIL
jgi:hypothetical protein